MATMYSLFLGVLLAAVCCPVGIGDGAVATSVNSHVRIFANSRTPVPAHRRHTVLRNTIVRLATAELGVREATGNNDGSRVEEYLRYTGLGKGHAWCAAFISWCFGQAGLPQPRNPWSPALFPNANTYWKREQGLRDKVPGRSIRPSDLFAIYGIGVKRINHVGLVREAQYKYLITIEGNSNNRVESRRRHLSTIYALSDWIGN